MAKNRPFTETTGLNVTEAYIVAYRFATYNAVADLIVEGFIPQEIGENVINQIKNNTAKAMLGNGVPVSEEGTVFALNPNNDLFKRVTNDLADELDSIAEKMETEDATTY